MSSFKVGDKAYLDAAMSTYVEIVEHIGEGSQGDVYKVQLPKSKTIAAMKHLYYNYAEDSLVFAGGMSGKEAFHAKCNLLSRVPSPHPNFAWPIMVSPMTKHGKGFVYVMPLLAGYKNFNLAIKDSSLTMRQRALLSVEVLEPMIALHKQNLVYGDVSNNNILYKWASDGRVHVGIVDCENITTTKHNMGLLGSDDFRAPEQIAAKDTIVFPSIQTDIYGICVLLFELFCGHHPLFGELVANEDPTNENFIKHYGAAPHFCFGSGGNAALPVAQQRWEQLPEPMRIFFRCQFSPDRLHGIVPRLSLEDFRKIIRLSFNI